MSPETFRCRIYQAERSGPYTREELWAHITTTGRWWVTISEEYPAEYLETHVVEPVERTSTELTLDAMVREGTLRVTERTIEGGWKGPFGLAPTRVVKEYTRAS